MSYQFRSTYLWKLRIAFLSIVALICVGMMPCMGADTESHWTRFRGDDGTGVVSQCTVPLPWTEDDIAWSTPLPGKGNGSPIVQGNRVFVMSADADSAERYLLAFDLSSGEELWRKTYPSTAHHMHSRSSYASCTPCANNDAVFFTWATPDSVVLIALAHDGKELWTRDLGRFISQHGYGASPVLFGDKLILFNSQAAQQLPKGVEPGRSRVMAFNESTGATLWESPRKTTRACYGVPHLFQDVTGQDAILFSNTGDGLFALSLATGKPLWSKSVFGQRCVSSPFVVNGLAIGTEGSGGGSNVLYAVDMTGDHDVRFKIDSAAPYVPSPVVLGDLMFLWGDRGMVSCVRLPTGKTEWKKRIGGNVSTSPVIAGEKLVGIAEDGTLTVLAAKDSFEEFGTVELQETTRATPMVARDYMLVRTDSNLICIGKP